MVSEPTLVLPACTISPTVLQTDDRNAIRALY
jgi:hypothetical protein